MGPGMNDMEEILEPDRRRIQDRFGVPALLLAPAVLRIVIAGRDLDTELDSLVTAVSLLQGSDGFMRSFVFEMAVDLAQTVEETGIVGLADAAKMGLDPDERAMALQIGVVAVFSSPQGGDGDIGVLAAIAEQLGLSEDEFTEAFESAQRAVAQR